MLRSVNDQYSKSWISAQKPGGLVRKNPQTSGVLEGKSLKHLVFSFQKKTSNFDYLHLPYIIII